MKSLLKSVFLRLPLSLQDLIHRVVFVSKYCARTVSSDLFWLKVVWRGHTLLVRQFSGHTPTDLTFLLSGVKQGAFPHDLTDKFKSEINKFEKIPFRIESCLPGFRKGLDDAKKYDFLNKSHIYLEPDSIQLSKLAPLLELLKEPIKSCLGYPSKVVNVRFWKTPVGALEKGPNNWHKDGMPLEIMKLLIYFSDASVDKGTTEIITKNGDNFVVNGLSGTWVLFWNSMLLHRGLAPKLGERIICEVTLVPAFRDDFHPIFAGQNAQFPTFPWSVRKNNVL